MADRPLIERTVTLRFDPTEMALRGRIGAYRLHATHDPRETTAKARATFLSRFEDEVDPQRVLPEEERQRRAEAARRAHFAKLAYLSARARRAKSGQKKAAGDQPAASGTEARRGSVDLRG